MAEERGHKVGGGHLSPKDSEARRRGLLHLSPILREREGDIINGVAGNVRVIPALTLTKRVVQPFEFLVPAPAPQGVKREGRVEHNFFEERFGLNPSGFSTIPSAVRGGKEGLRPALFLSSLATSFWRRGPL